MATNSTPQQPAKSPRLYFTIPKDYWSRTPEQRRAWLDEVAESATSRLKSTTKPYRFIMSERQVGRIPVDAWAPTEIMQPSGQWVHYGMTPRDYTIITTDLAQQLADGHDLYAPSAR